jgi:hypothetical protein
MTRTPRRITVIVLAAGGVLACNLLIYAIGRASGGTFTYTQNGKAIHVDAASVAIMSVLPLAIGLAVVAGLSRWWPAVITIAKVVAPVLAIATIGFMTIPAHFDTTSTVFLAATHVTLAAASVLALTQLRWGTVHSRALPSPLGSGVG